MAHFIVIFKKKKKSPVANFIWKKKNDWGERMWEKRMKRNEGGIIWKKWEEEGERRESN